MSEKIRHQSPGAAGYGEQLNGNESERPQNGRSFLPAVIVALHYDAPPAASAPPSKPDYEEWFQTWRKGHYGITDDRQLLNTTDAIERRDQQRGALS